MIRQQQQQQNKQKQQQQQQKQQQQQQQDIPRGCKQGRQPRARGLRWEQVFYHVFIYLSKYLSLNFYLFRPALQFAPDFTYAFVGDAEETSYPTRSQEEEITQSPSAHLSEVC